MIINNWGFLRHPSGHEALLTQYGRGGLTLYRSSLVRLESTATVLVIMSPISVMLFAIWNIIIKYGKQSRTVRDCVKINGVFIGKFLSECFLFSP